MRVWNALGGRPRSWRLAVFTVGLVCVFLSALVPTLGPAPVAFGLLLIVVS